MSFYLPLAHFAILTKRYGLAICYLRRALSMANRKRNHKAAGQILVAIRCCHEAKANA